LKSGQRRPRNDGQWPAHVESIEMRDYWCPSHRNSTPPPRSGLAVSV